MNRLKDTLIWVPKRPKWSRQIKIQDMYWTVDSDRGRGVKGDIVILAFLLDDFEKNTSERLVRAGGGCRYGPWTPI